MKRYGVMGGTFDPIHLAHIHIAKKAKEELSLDKIIFMPAGSPPHKDNSHVTEASLRLLMVNEAIKEYEGFEVSSYEIEKQGLSYTYETLENLKTIDNSIYFIAGADSLMNISLWKNPKRILELATLVIFTRPGFDINKLKEKRKEVLNMYGGEIILLELSDLPISSTEIRNRIKLNKSVMGIIDQKVEQFIKERGLYKEDV